MKIHFPLAFFFSLLGAFYLVPPTTEPSRPSQERSIGRLPFERNEPIAIRSVRVGGKKIRRSSRFVADDDWLGGLAIDIKNRSDKVILLATVQIQFPRPSGSDGPIAVDQLVFGNYELCSRLPNAPPSLQRLMPGETAEITLPVAELEGIRIMLTANGYPTSPERLQLRIGKVVFDDNTMWQRGSTLRRDKQLPHVWTQIDMPSLAKKTPFKTPISEVSAATKYTRFQSSFWPERLFFKASYSATLPVAQSGCHRYLGTANLDCGISGWACQYEKDLVSSDFGCFYLAAASFRCKTASGENCGVNYRSTQIANPCSGCGGGGGGGGGNLEDFNNGYGDECFDDSECDAGLYCDWSSNTCQY